ncbi:MAG: acylglycerol kinase family protein [Rhodospirillales bacterium]|nr:acylglycerol kinase family protein [Rhodospirillales bacterium]
MITSNLQGIPMRRRVIVIYNPIAGYFSARRFARILKHVSALGATVTVRRTTRPGDAERMAGEVDRDVCDVLVAAGGDGTLNEIVNGLKDLSLPLAVMPIGTANVLAAEIRMPERSRHRADHCLRPPGAGQPRRRQRPPLCHDGRRRIRRAPGSARRPQGQAAVRPARLRGGATDRHVPVPLSPLPRRGRWRLFRGDVDRRRQRALLRRPVLLLAHGLHQRRQPRRLPVSGRGSMERRTLRLRDRPRPPGGAPRCKDRSRVRNHHRRRRNRTGPVRRRRRLRPAAQGSFHGHELHLRRRLLMPSFRSAAMAALERASRPWGSCRPD